MTIVLDWQKKLGYKKDPFVDKAHNKVFGLEPVQERINLFLLREEKLLVINADEGCGKTSLLLWLQNELKNTRKLLIIDLEEISSQEKLETYLQEQVITKVHSLFGQKKDFSFVKKRLEKKEFILAFEKVQLLTSAQARLVDELLQETKTKVIVLGSSEQTKKLTLNTKVSGTVAFPNYSNKDFMKLLQERIERCGSIGIFPFTKDDVSSLAKKSKHNPRKFLPLAKDFAIEQSLKNLKLPEKEIEKKTVEKKETKTELESAIQEEKKSGLKLFGKFRLEFSDDEEPAKEKKKEEKEDMSDDVLLDAEELRKIVEGKK